jgi:FAR-17a/AIG1-like protein
MVISLIYWPLVILYPQLILPQSSNSAHPAEVSPLIRMPLWIDLALHATPSLSILADFFLFESKYQWKDVQVGAPITTAAFALWYSLWVEHCGKINGVCK